MINVPDELMSKLVSAYVNKIADETGGHVWREDAHSGILAVLGVLEAEGYVMTKAEADLQDWDYVERHKQMHPEEQ